MIKTCFILFLLLVYFPLFSISENGDSLNYNLPSALVGKKKLVKVFQKLNSIRTSRQLSDSVFTIVHIGDSHIQGDYFTGEIRKQLQSYFGFAGIGAIFPYSLVKSYGPKGTQSKAEGKWEAYKLLTPHATAKLGVLGYGLTTSKEKSGISLSIHEKFPISNFNRLKIWHSADSASFDVKVNEGFQLIEQKKFSSGWAVSDFKSMIPVNQFTLETSCLNGAQQHFEFLGCELMGAHQKGINYHHLGVVGAQFTHFIQSASFANEQLEYLNPDIIIFSFGTNEAYDQHFDSLNYYNEIANYFERLGKQFPNTAVILTTAPDTRGQNRIPPHQTNVNSQLKKIATRFDLNVFDLNAEMGGWGSLYEWHKKNFTLKDKLHFNASGYALQGRLFTHSFLSTYNLFYPEDLIDLKPLQDSIIKSMTFIFNKTDVDTLNLQLSSFKNQTLRDTLTVTPPKTSKATENSQSAIVHTVKNGESIYKIGRKYKINYKKIAKQNDLSENSVLRPGMKLIIKK